MKYGASGHQVVCTRLDYSLEDIQRPHVQVRSVKVGNLARVDVTGRYLTSRALCTQPLGNRAVPTTHFQTSPARFQSDHLQQ